VKGLVLKRALQVYEAHITSLPDTGADNQHERGLLIALKQRKANAPALRRGL
jgi:hypothetical protein